MYPSSPRKNSLRQRLFQTGLLTLRATWKFGVLTLFKGPKKLLTSRISSKCAAVIIAMCTPALICSALLVIPGMIFQSPYQNTYFQFARVLENDPSRWFAVILCGTCALISLAMPATMSPPRPLSIE